MAPTRRDVLRAGLGAAATATLLSACGTGADSGGGSSNAGVALPDRIPFAGPTPDLPAAGDVPPGYYAYPKQLVRSVSGTPLSGGTVTGMTMTFLSFPPGRDENAAWQEVEKRLGGKLDISVVSAADYETKFNTTIAGGELPDMILYSSGLNNVPQFAQATCADLGEHLAGNKIAEYKNLAAIPTVAWQNCVVGGKLYALPVCRNITGGSGFVNMRFFKELGIEDHTRIANSAEEFLEICKKLTDPGKDRYALATSNGSMYSLTLFTQIFRVPYGWRVDGGKLTSARETPEFKEAVAFARKLYQAGVFYPGSEGFTTVQRGNAFTAGQAAMVYDGFPAFPGFWTGLRAQHPDNDPRPYVPFGHDGGDGVTYQDNVILAYTFVKKAEPDKVKEVLRVADFLAAPFGSEEYQLLKYGVEGVHFTRDATGNPVPNERGTQEMTVPWDKFAANPPVVYNASGGKAYADYAHQALAKMLPMAVANPTTGYRSETSDKEGTKLAKPVTDLVTSIIAGRAELAELDGALDTWRKNGGDKIRGEYESAMAAG
ncbi:lipoprotein [Actinorhabdospora filicis]|uniref:Lipoprotein n=1 Tax=Actinorhabdospora filicis TaxID=1785913 RepID=A0A9W6SVV8_9ACTN|nr:extracellular solute-binding protein [Actinorhabdospora filicis]GLZ81701.1 lipoprotein [Actinorhabdospora filicis]